MRFNGLAAAFAALGLLVVATDPVTAQLGARPPDEWIETLDGPVRVASMKIDEVVAALELRPGQMVADIGAGSGLLEVPLAMAVSPGGRVFAEDIEAGFFPKIKTRVQAARVTNVEIVLGTFTDPALPVKAIDLALFHDVMHHVEKRSAYVRTLRGYLAPGGRIAVVDYEAGMGPHKDQPALEVSREQLTALMREAGLTQVQDIRMFPDKYFLVFARP